MQHASDPQHEALLSALYEAAAEPASWQDALAAVLDWTQADAVMVVGVENGRRRVLLSQGHEPRHVADYGRDWLRDDPRLAPAAGIDARIHGERHAAFLDWQIAQGFAASFADRLRDSDDSVNWLLLSSRDAARQGRVAIRYGRLRRHLERALLLTRRHRQLAHERDALSSVVDELPLAVLLLDADGDVVHANTSAWRLLARDDALQLRDGRLHALRDGDDRQLQALLRAGDGDSQPDSTGWLALPRRGGEPPYTIAVRGRADAANGDAQAANGHLRVLIGDAADTPPIEAADLGAIFNLTTREGQVCVRLLRGLSVDETAVDLGISPRTARVYLQQVYGKIGVHRQSDLVRMLMCCPAAAPARGTAEDETDARLAHKLTGAARQTPTTATQPNGPPSAA